MDIHRFWALIDASRREGPQRWTQHEVLEGLLLELPPGEIASYARHFDTLFWQAYRWDLWAVAFIIERGCSDDGFMDFRAWLVAQGRKFYEECLNNPERVADRADDVICYEQMNYVASRAYKRKTGTDMPRVTGPRPPEPLGRAWEEKDLPRLFPELYQRFWH